MNLSQFFDHWSITENPFRGEEARHDAVFARMGILGDEADAPERSLSAHSDFEKILGELTRPSTSIVFGEKGSGKTAIRMQIADRVGAHNRAHPDEKILLIPYDDLNTFLDQLVERAGATGKGRDVGKALDRIRLVDHLDAVLSIGVGRVVNALLRDGREPPPANLGEDAARRARRMGASLKRDLLVLQAVYDQADARGERTGRLRRLLHVGAPAVNRAWIALMLVGWAAPVGLGLWWLLAPPEGESRGLSVLIGAGVALLVYAAVLGKWFLWDRFVLSRLGSRIRRQLRMLPRESAAYSAALRRLEPALRGHAVLPLSGSDEQRYAMLARLRRVLEQFGFRGMLVVIDRVDEPTLVSGDAERMRSIIWPILNNKFLQAEGVGLKMLLPVELRHALFKESSAFFQEARLDKQNLVERLTWTGPMLYDLCNARLAACRAEGADPVTLLDLFAEDVTRQDVVDALEQMRQPRDAFKFVYRCLNEHCSNVTADQNEWRIPRLVLDSIRRQEADRVQQLSRGIRPA
jgi:hypothetical protein